MTENVSIDLADLHHGDCDIFLGLLENKPFGPALMNAIFWPAGVYNIYIAGG